MTKDGKYYAEKKLYVEEICGNFLKPLRGFKALAYARCTKDDGEYIRASSITGESFTMDVSGKELPEILQAIAMLAIGESTDLTIHDTDKLLKVSSLFEGGRA